MNKMLATNKEEIFEISSDTLKHLLDYSSDEIFIFNHNQKIVYVNSACERIYGVTKEELIGKSNNDLIREKYWSPSVFPIIHKSKKPVYIKQVTKTGRELFTAAIPILDTKGEVELVITTAREPQHYRLQTQEYDKYRTDFPSDYLIYQSKEFKKITKFAQRIARSDCTVLIHGESGTGKGVLAKYIHKISSRREENFLAINCAALPEELLESELFGYEPGAFTGANSEGRVGLLASANNGTIFLDEIGDISPALQVKLLQVIQDKEFIPVGSNQKKKVNVRFFAATNKDLEQLVKEGKFREDLYYRLNVVDLEVPPLRNRQDDIEPLIYFFLEKFNESYQSNKVISDQCIDILKHYHWPGNVRQLENLIERLVIVSDEIIELTDLPETFKESKPIEQSIKSQPTLQDALNETRKYLVRKSYKKHSSSRKVAEDLAVSQSTASRLIRQFCSDL